MAHILLTNIFFVNNRSYILNFKLNLNESLRFLFCVTLNYDKLNVDLFIS